jgi:ribonuclease-3
MEEISKLEKKLKLNFKDKNMLRMAFIHRSYLNEHPEERLGQNERLEFLGDSVLGMVVSKHLFIEYPNQPEGDLTNFRSSLVNAKMLSKAAVRLHLGNYLYLSKGEEATGGRNRQYIMANTFEALIGAIFLDQGLDAAEAFIKKFILPNLKEILEKNLYKDFKSQLQERAQEKYGVTPTYKVIEERGPDHAKTFKTAVFIEQKKIAAGEGNSKQEAEQKTAKVALENWPTLS